MHIPSEITLMAGGVAVALAFIWFCGWYARHEAKKLQIENPKDRAEVEDNYRKTTAQVLGAAAVVVVFAYNLTKDNQASEQVSAQAAANEYATGVKLFTEKEPTVVASAIYLLERVAAAREEYRAPIAHTLVSLIRSKTPEKKPEKAVHIGVELRAAVHVLGRTATISDDDATTLNLDGVNLAYADFSNLKGFANRRFDGADLRGANFIGANLQKAQFSGSEFNDSGAYGPEFTEEVVQTDAWSFQKYWYAVQFDRADLTNAQFDGSGLVGALFGSADVKGANFERANISRADFSAAKNLDRANFKKACADTAPTFPENFVCPLRKCTAPEEDKQQTCGYFNVSRR